MLGIGNIGVGITVYLNNQFSAAAQNVTQSFMGMYGNMRRANAGMKAGMSALATSSTVLAAAGAGAIYALKGAVDAAAEFDNSIIATGAITGATTEQLKMLREQARGLARELPFSQTELAEAMRDLGKGGVSTEQLNTMTRYAGILAQVAEMPIGGESGAAGDLIQTMVTFNKGLNETAEVVDILSLASNKTTVNVKDLMESLKYAGNQAVRLNLGFKETITFLSILGQSGIRGSLAGTVMSNFYRYFNMAAHGWGSKKQNDVLKQMGLGSKQLLDSHGNLLAMDKLLEVLHGKFKGLSNDSKDIAASILFGVRGARGVSLINSLDGTKLGPSFSSLLKDLDHSKGTAMEVFHKKMESYTNQVVMLKNAWLDFKINFFDAMKPVLLPLVHLLTHVAKFLKVVTDNPLGKWFMVAATGALVFGTALLTLTAIMARYRLMVWSLQGGTLANIRGAFTGGWATTFGQMLGATNRSGVANTKLAMALRGIGYNAAGRRISTTTGRFMSKAAFRSALSKPLSIWAQLGLVAGRLTPVFMGLARLTIIGTLAVVIFKAIDGFNGLTYILKSMFNYVLWMNDFVETMSVRTANRRFHQRAREYQAEFRKNQTIENPHSIDNHTTQSLMVMDSRNNKMDKVLEALNKANQKPQTINIHLDGLKVAEHKIKGHEDKNIVQHLNQTF